MKKDLVRTSVFFVTLATVMFLVNYAVPVLLILLNHVPAAYYKTQFYWQLVVSSIYTGYIAHKVANEKPTEEKGHELDDTKNSISN